MEDLAAPKCSPNGSCVCGGTEASDLCRALCGMGLEPGTPGHLAATVEALLGCRSFLWDVLTDGEWSGCARREIRKLTKVYGSEAVAKAFEE